MLSTQETPMSVNTRSVAAPPEAVFAVLANGWLFPAWVVGSTRMRGVDEAWPAVGARLHHSVGVWPVLINDSTSVLQWEPPRRAVLQARIWPVGEATVALDVEPEPGGCRVSITEVPSTGPWAKVPDVVSDAAIKVRNVETLRRLAYLAEGHAP
jgi:uncharacterized protein YndB with AHSA1/START domain